MNNDLDARWSLLNADPLRMVFQLYDANHPLDLYIGKNVENSRVLIFISTEQPPTIKDLKSIKIRSYKRDDGKWMLLLILENAELNPLFTLLCYDLIESSRWIDFNTANKLIFLLKRLSNWRRLFENGFSDLLTENEVRGLCGELLFLDRLIPYLGIVNAVKAWVGPLKADQDFQSKNESWEIKTVRPNSESVRISSEWQLKFNGKPIFLIVFALECVEKITDDNVFTLNSLVEKIRFAISSDHDAYFLFEEKIHLAGYTHRNEYNENILKINTVYVFDVKNEFPRICTEELRRGVSNVSYSIDLSECSDFICQSSILE